MSYNKWSDDITLKFFDLYENHGCLWNPKDNNYKDPDARGSALASIVQAMDMPGLNINLLKRKIRIIRTMYRRHHNKVAKSRRMNMNEYRPRLFWFGRADSFLNKIASEIKSPSLNKLKEVDVDPSCSKKPMIKQKRKEIANEKVNTAHNSIRSETNSSSTDMDDCTVFGQMIACELRKLNNKNKAVAKNKIQNCIFDLQIEEMSYESQQTQRYHQMSVSKSSSITDSDVQLCEIDIE